MGPEPGGGHVQGQGERLFQRTPLPQHLRGKRPVLCPGLGSRCQLCTSRSKRLLSAALTTGLSDAGDMASPAGLCWGRGVAHCPRRGWKITHHSCVVANSEELCCWVVTTSSGCKARTSACHFSGRAVGQDPSAAPEDMLAITQQQGLASHWLLPHQDAGSNAFGNLGLCQRRLRQLTQAQ